MIYLRSKKDGLYDIKTGYTTIKNELITEAEKEKQFPNVSINNFDHVNISKQKIFWNFGTRFEIKKGETNNVKCKN